MQDFIFTVAIVAFFVVGITYTYACGKL